MNRLTSLLFLVLIPLTGPFADPLGTPSVFLDTDPMGARIEVDGKLLSDQTPTLLRGLPPGRHTVDLWHEGFLQETRVFTVADGAVPVVEVNLTPASVVLAFPENRKVDGGSGTLDTAGSQFRIPPGTYTVGSSAGTVRLVPVFPDDGLLTASGWALAIVTGAAVLSGASDAIHMTTGWMDHPSSITPVLLGTAAFDLAWYWALLDRKARWTRDAAPKAAPQAENLDQVRDVWAKGEEALQAGDLDTALGLFTRVIRDYPTSRLVPGAWFRVARIHSVTGHRELAAGEYRLMAETYPQAEYFDKARKAMADLYEAAGNKEAALASLSEMVLTDGYFDKADIEAQKARLAPSAVPEATHAP